VLKHHLRKLSRTKDIDPFVMGGGLRKLGGFGMANDSGGGVGCKNGRGVVLLALIRRYCT